MTTEPELSSSKVDQEAPRGRVEIRTAVLDAADRLFASRRPSQVSIREIAASAGVNHALVHRHFETKENLVREVLDRADARLSLLWDHLADAGEVAHFLLGHRELYQHALLALEGAVMDGVAEGVSSRLVDGLADRLRARGAAEQEAATVAVAVVVLLLGWATYGEWLSSAAHPTCEQGLLGSRIATMLDQVLQGDLEPDRTRLPSDR